MPIIASDKGGSDFEPTPAGSHQAVCYGVVDLGTQLSNNPQFADARKVCILWELPTERLEFKDGNTGQMVEKPRAISATYTLSLGTKANLRKMLESWRAKPFTQEELSGFDISKLIGANCLLSVIHKPGSGKNAGKVFANVAGVSALPKGMKKLPMENASLMFSLSDIPAGEEISFPKNLPEWLRTMINQSKEVSDHHVTSNPPPASTQTQETVDEDVPF